MKPYFQPSNYTQVPNEVFDVLMKELSPNEFKILMVIVRKTIGFHKQTDRIPFSQFMEATGIKNRTTLSENLKKLKEKEIIFGTESVPCRYGLNADWYGNRTKTGTEIVPETSETGTEIVLSKESNINKKENIVAPPLVLVKQKRSEEEKTAFDATWKAFEKDGQKLSGALQAKSIWEMIDRVRDRSDWPHYLERIVNKFFDILSKRPKGMECISSQPRLPHILAGPKIWARVELLLSKPQGDQIDEWTRRELKRIEREDAKKAGVCF